MNTLRRYDFNLPWPAVIICAAFYAGASACVIYLAREYVGVISGAPPWVLGFSIGQTCSKVSRQSCALMAGHFSPYGRFKS